MCDQTNKQNTTQGIYLDYNRIAGVLTVQDDCNNSIVTKERVTDIKISQAYGTGKENRLTLCVHFGQSARAFEIDKEEGDYVVDFFMKVMGSVSFTGNILVCRPKLQIKQKQFQDEVLKDLHSFLSAALKNSST